MNMQSIDLYQPIVASRVGAPPLTLRVGITQSANSTVGGPQQNALKAETYVLLSALPTDLQERVKLAVQALLAGG